MHIFLDTDNHSLAAEVANRLSHEVESSFIHQTITDVEFGQPLDERNNTAHIYYGTDLFGHLSEEQARLSIFAFASEGAIMFSDKPRKEFPSPLYAGPLAVGNSDLLLVHLRYAARRAADIKELPVKYFGVTMEDPKNILVIDNKSPEKNLPLIMSVLEHAPSNWWHSVAFVSTSNAAHLFEFFEDTMSYSTPVAMTSAAVAKLNQVGVEYVDASKLEHDVRFGARLRDLTRRANDTQLS